MCRLRMENRATLFAAAAVVLYCFAIEAAPGNVVIGSTTFPWTPELQKCLGKMWQSNVNSATPGGDMRRCIRRMRTTTRAPNETYFDGVDRELVVAEEDSTALLRCQVFNLGRKHVSWMRQGAVLSHMGRLYTADRRFKMEAVNSTFNLRIERVTQADAGNYKCKVLARTTSLERVVQLMVPSLPVITSLDPTTPPFFNQSQPGRRFFNRTADAALFCNATGSPEPEVSWKRVQWRGDPIGGSEPVWGDTVLLPNISERDAGIYNCSAWNGVGSVEGSVEVVVQYKPVVRTPTSVIRAGWGDYVKLACEVSAVPRADITWKINNIVLKNDGQGQIRNGRQYTTHIIMSVDPDSDYANYTCRATNFISTSQVTIELHGRPLAPTVTSSPVSRRRHAYAVSWRPGVRTDGGRPQQIPISAFVVLFRGWWIETKGGLQRMIYTHETPLREVIPAREGRQAYDYIIRDLRPNTTYEMDIYAKNQQGKGDVTSFTFYTANENAPSTPRLVTADAKTTTTRRISPQAQKSGVAATSKTPASPTVVWVLVIIHVYAQM